MRNIYVNLPGSTEQLSINDLDRLAYLVGKYELEEKTRTYIEKNAELGVYKIYYNPLAVINVHGDITTPSLSGYQDVITVLNNHGITCSTIENFYYRLKDNSVLSVLLNNSVGDTIGVTEQALRNISSIGEWFRENIDISYFDELELSKLTSLGTYAFYNCSNLRTIEIPDTCTSLGDSAFRGTSVQYFNFKNVTTLYNSFYNVDTLKYIYVRKPATNSFDTNRFNLAPIESITYSSLETLLNSLYGCAVVNSDTTKVEKNFYIGTEDDWYSYVKSDNHEPTNLTPVTLIENSNTSYTSIPQYCLRGNNLLTSFIDTAETITTIGSSAFYKCRNLETAEFPSVVTIGSSCFSYTKISSLDLPECTTASDSLISYNTNLTSISLPNLISIGSSSFYGCTGLTTVNFPELTTITGGSLFLGCENIQTIYLPKLVSIGNGSTFYGCKALQSINLPELTTISTGNYTFYNCTNIESVSMPKLTNLPGQLNFESCLALTTVDLQEAVKVGSYDFRYDTNLETVNFKMATSVGYLSFYGCTKLRETNFTLTVTYIGEYAFYNCQSLPNDQFPKIDTTLSSITSLAYSFGNCYLLEEADLTISEGLTLSWLGTFYGCRKLKSIPQAFFDSNITDMRHVFYGCYDMITNSVLTINAPNCRLACNLFYGNSTIEELILNIGILTNSDTNDRLSYLALRLTSLKKLTVTADLSAAYSRVTSNILGDGSGIDRVSDTLEEVDFSGIIGTSTLTGFTSGGYGRNIKKYDLTGWNFSNVTTFLSAFYACYNMEELPIGINSSTVTKIENTQSMFSQNNKIKHIDLGLWNASKITLNSNMFYYCHQLKDINIKMPVINNNMYYLCYRLTNIDTTEVTTITSTDAIFYNTYNLHYLRFTKLLSLPGRTFNGATGILAIVLDQENLPTWTDDNFLFNNNEVRIYIKSSKRDLCLANQRWNSLYQNLRLAFVDEFPLKKDYYSVFFHGDKYYDIKRKPTVNTKFYIDYCKHNNWSTGNQYMFGCKTSDGVNARFAAHFTNYYLYYSLGNGNSYGVNMTAVSTANRRYKYMFDALNNSIQVNGTDYRYSSSSVTIGSVPDLNIYLGAVNDNDEASNILDYTCIYEFRVYEGDNVVLAWIANEHGGFDIYANEEIELLDADVLHPLNEYVP